MNKERRFKLLVAGVGGQGVLTVARWLGEATVMAGQEVVLGQLHGMAQRGGSVQSTVLFGPGHGSFIEDAVARRRAGLGRPVRRVQPAGFRPRRGGGATGGACPMKLQRIVVAVCCLLGAAFAAVEPPSKAERYWPQWRGPLGTGVAPHARPPVEWSETTNVRWKIEIPGKGLASPIVWGDRIFGLTAIATAQRSERKPPPPPERPGQWGVGTDRFQDFAIYAVRRQDGTILWQRTCTRRCRTRCGNCRSCLDLFGCPAFYMEDGEIRIDPALCNGCGVCAAFCPNGAIQPVDLPEA